MNPKTYTITVDRVPSWGTPTDVIVKRGVRVLFVSRKTIPRWRHWLNRIAYWWRSL